MCSSSHRELIGTTAKMDGFLDQKWPGLIIGEFRSVLDGKQTSSPGFITRTIQVTNLNFGLLSFFFTLFNVFKVTRPSYFVGVLSYFEALWYPHLYFDRESNI